MIQIYGTIGPACSSEEIMQAMFREGMTGMRLNLSHTSLLESRDTIDAFRKAAEKAQKKPELLIDMQGPELRIGTLAQDITVRKDETYDIPMQEGVLPHLEKNDHVLIDDGKFSAEVVEVRSGSAVLCFHNSGILSSRKSIKIEGKEVHGPALTGHDKENLDHAEEYGVTAIMEPFVNDGKTLQEIRHVLHEKHLDQISIYAKIETMEGVKNLPAIIPEADMIVIARGDLGNDMPLWKLPAVQKEIEQACRKAGRPFMVVTQMLTSMIRNPFPTRAEVSDIFNAVNDGASAVMVTNETAVGKYPVETIRYLYQTSKEAEAWCTSQKL
jgi:pyruvate kinase